MSAAVWRGGPISLAGDTFAPALDARVFDLAGVLSRRGSALCIIVLPWAPLRRSTTGAVVPVGELTLGREPTPTLLFAISNVPHAGRQPLVALP
jgi:hypothetical protein